MLNLSSNDYLGLASDRALREEFLRTPHPGHVPATSSSSRLLTGNFTVYEELEAELARLFGMEAALVFNSGYHANTGILPAVSDTQTLILADKLVHASLIDGIRPVRRQMHPLPPQRFGTTGTSCSKSTTPPFAKSSSSPKASSAWTATKTCPPLAELETPVRQMLLYVDEATLSACAAGRDSVAEESGCTGDIDFLGHIH